MAYTKKALVPAQLLAAAATTLYTAVGARGEITKATLTNTSASNVTVSVHLVLSGGSAGAGNVYIDGKTIAAHETYTCPELVGHGLAAGGFISAIAGTGSVLRFAVDGAEIS